jgi:hypothetical protein
VIAASFVDAFRVVMLLGAGLAVASALVTLVFIKQSKAKE